MAVAKVGLAEYAALQRRCSSTDLAAQGHKLAFLESNTDRRTVSPDRVEAPATTLVVRAGAVIPAALITGLRSVGRVRLWQLARRFI